MPNITLTVPSDVLRAARIRAAEQGTSVSALVREFLVSVAEPDAEFRRLEKLQHSLVDQLTAFKAADRVEREDIHDRALR